MSCHGCRVLRKGCGDTCVIRPCLEWIPSPDAQSHATLFLSKFFGRSDLLNFLSSAPPDHRRTELFRSLLYEAVGRTVNPINGALGLLATGNWHVCESAVQTVLAGGTPMAFDDAIMIPEVDESAEGFQGQGEWWKTTMVQNQAADAGNGNNGVAPPDDVVMADMAAAEGAEDLEMGLGCGGGGEPKLLKLFE